MHNQRLIRYKHLRYKIYKLLEQPGRYPIIYHRIFALVIFVSFTLSVILTTSKYKDNTTLNDIVEVLEQCLLVVIVLEYFFRIWSAGAIPRFMGATGKLRFIFSFYMIVDMVIIVVTTSALINRISFPGIRSPSTRVTGLAQILRILRLDRYHGEFKILGRLLYTHKRELLTSYYIGLLTLITATFIVYLIEEHSSDKEKMVRNLADSMYWGIVTVSMVGYGDLSPRNFASKFLACIFSVVAVALFSIPVGIIGTGYALQAAKEKKKRHQKSIQEPAALYIQRRWRSMKVITSLRKLRGACRTFTREPDAFPSMVGGAFGAVGTLTQSLLPVSRWHGFLAQGFFGVGMNKERFFLLHPTEHLALIFYHILRETSAKMKFVRSCNPYVSLEDVNTVVKRRIHQMQNKVDNILTRKQNELKNMEAIQKHIDMIEKMIDEVTRLPEECTLCEVCFWNQLKKNNKDDQS